MNWDAVAAIAELMGAVGVILTLLYMARQIGQTGSLIEQNSQLLSTSVTIANREAGNDLAKILGGDRDIARVYWAGLEDRESLEDTERQQFDALLFLSFSAFAQDFATDGSRATAEFAAFILSSSGARSWWRVYDSTHPPEFRAFVESQLERHLAAENETNR